jgi:hypothetical protein
MFSLWKDDVCLTFSSDLNDLIDFVVLNRGEIRFESLVLMLEQENSIVAQKIEDSVLFEFLCDLNESILTV